jgi:hypothetical protein
MADRKAGDAEGVEPRRDRHRLLPVRPPQAIRHVEFFDQPPVGDDLIVRRRSHDELAGRLVVRVVDHRQPLARAIRPVLAEDRALAVDVRDEAEPVAGNARVADADGDLFAGPHRRGQGNPQSILGVGERCRAAADRHCRNGHAFPGRRGGQIKGDDLDRFDDAKRDGGVARNLVGSVVERQPEGVMDRVDARLAWIGVRVGWCGSQRHEQGDGQRSSQHELPFMIHDLTPPPVGQRATHGGRISSFGSAPGLGTNFCVRPY